MMMTMTNIQQEAETVYKICKHCSQASKAVVVKQVKLLSRYEMFSNHINRENFSSNKFQI
jgi:hypothetical protein